MSRTPNRHAWVFALLAGLLLAGCAGQTKSTPAEPSPSATSIYVGEFGAEGGGSLVAIVVDESYAPIGGATVGLESFENTLETDEAGIARFVGLPVGGYKVIAQKLGFQANAKNAEVADGEETEVTVVLAKLPEVGPYHVTRIFDGLIGCSPQVYYYLNLGGYCGPLGKQYLEFDVELDLRSTVSELLWQRNSALAAETMRLNVWQNVTKSPTISAVHRYAEVKGPSPLIARTNASYAGLSEKNTLFTNYVSVPNGELSVSLTIEQPFRIYETEFYREPAPPDFAARPDR